MKMSILSLKKLVRSEEPNLLNLVTSIHNICIIRVSKTPAMIAALIWNSIVKTFPKRTSSRAQSSNRAVKMFYIEFTLVSLHWPKSICNRNKDADRPFSRNR